MAMIFDEKTKVLRFDVPNSEATIEAQHFGILDRTVGAYYMSDNSNFCKCFLNQFDGEYYIDISLVKRNAEKIINKLKEKGYEKAFKRSLIPQSNILKVFELMLENGDYLYKMKTPTINENEKYLKLDNEDSIVNNFRSLLLGDLCSLYIKKIGLNGFLFYVDCNPSFDEIMDNNKILKWME